MQRVVNWCFTIFQQQTSENNRCFSIFNIKKILNFRHTRCQTKENYVFKKLVRCYIG